MYLLDTNVMSEIRKIKNGKANQGVADWFFATPLDKVFLNDIVLLELKLGALLVGLKNDPIQTHALNFWVDIELPKQFGERILPITRQICLIASTLHIPNPRDRHDALIGATALAHNLILVSRNQKDFKNIDGLKFFNPFIEI